jgi:hypothetical protein
MTSFMIDVSDSRQPHFGSWLLKLNTGHYWAFYFVYHGGPCRSGLKWLFFAAY